MARTSTNGSKADTTVADLSEQIAILRNDLSDLSGTIAGLGKTKTAELKDAAAQQADVAREKGAKAAEYVSERAHEAQAQANDFVKTQPGAALGIAAGLGFLVGYLSSRR
ncbi:DUF883 family protein [Arenibacterium sp. CAU 1754]